MEQRAPLQGKRQVAFGGRRVDRDPADVVGKVGSDHGQECPLPGERHLPLHHAGLGGGKPHVDRQVRRIRRCPQDRLTVGAALHHADTDDRRLGPDQVCEQAVDVLEVLRVPLDLGRDQIDHLACLRCIRLIDPPLGCRLRHPSEHGRRGDRDQGHQDTDLDRDGEPPVDTTEERGRHLRRV